MSKNIKPKDVFTDVFIGNLVYLVTKRVFAFLIALLIIGFILFTFAFSLSVGNSMQPTIPDNSIVITKQDKDIGVGDVVILHSPKNNDIYTKRVVGKAGDVINLEYGHLYVNNVLQKENYIKGETFFQSIDYSVNYEVPDEEYYVLGDNREDSMDSRDFGSIKKDLIIGKVIYVFPIGEFIDSIKNK